MRTGRVERDRVRMTSDNTVLTAISQLADEEHHLRRREARQMATDFDRARIAEIDIELARCWDLLRQRRARRRAGLDDEGATVRSSATVQRYLQ